MTHTTAPICRGIIAQDLGHFVRSQALGLRVFFASGTKNEPRHIQNRGADAWHQQKGPELTEFRSKFRWLHARTWFARVWKFTGFRKKVYRICKMESSSTTAWRVAQHGKENRFVSEHMTLQMFLPSLCIPLPVKEEHHDTTPGHCSGEACRFTLV